MNSRMKKYFNIFNLYNQLTRQPLDEKVNYGYENNISMNLNS